MKNKVWFFASARDNRVNNYILDTTFNDGSPGDNAEYIRDLLGRGTAQLTPKVKVTGYYDRVSKHRAHAMSALQDPETAAVEWTSPNYSTGSAKGTWSATPKLLMEGGYSFNVELRDVTSTGIRATRQMDPVSDILSPSYQTNPWYANVGETSDIGGRKISAATTSRQEWPRQGTWQASATYITGSHTIKGGFQHECRDIPAHRRQQRRHYRGELHDRRTGGDGKDWEFSQPKTVTITNTPRSRQERMNHISGIYAQESVSLQAADRERRYPLGVRELAGGSHGSSRRPLGAGARAAGGEERPELERLGAAFELRVRPVRRRPDGGEVLAQPLQQRRNHDHRGGLQHPRGADVLTAVDGFEP